MKFKLKTVSDVVSWRMCVGCGACEYICENRNVSLQNFTEHGIRPVLGSIVLIVENVQVYVQGSIIQKTLQMSKKQYRN